MRLKIPSLTGSLILVVLCANSTSRADDAAPSSTSSSESGGEQSGSGGGGSGSGGGGSGSGGGGGGGQTGNVDVMRKEDRKDFEVPAAKIDVNIPAVLAQSENVKKFDEELETFTSLYPMKCGGGQKVHGDADGVARCMPDMNDIIVVEQEDDLKTDNCMRVMLCKAAKNGLEMCDPNSIKIWLTGAGKLLTSTSVKDYTEAVLKVEKDQLIFNVDPGCDLSLRKSHTMRHRFQNKPDGIREMMKKYPGFYLQPPIRHKRRLYRGNINIGLPAIYDGVKPIKHVDCDAKCDEGQLFYYKMDANQIFYGKIFVDGYTCDWFKVCLRGEQGVLQNVFSCNSADMIHVYVRNGFVVMPRAMNGATIRLVKSTKTATYSADDYKSQPTQIGLDYDGERFSIWSVGKERVASSAKVDHDGHIVFYFSSHNCLVKQLGIKHFGLLNGKVYQINSNVSIDSVSKGKGDAVTYETVKTRPTLGTLATEKPTPNASAAAAPTTTAERNLKDLLSKSGYRVRKARTGWLIWALFYGFFIGSFASVVIFGALIYFARRTVYSNWYRGMYKRYGCDASGVTGGITGSQFGTTTTGVSGFTSGFTTGGTTTGGTTTGGTTTGGTTTGTTTGGTTGTTVSGGTTTGGTTGTTSGTTGDSGMSTSGTSTGGTSTGDMVTM